MKSWTVSHLILTRSWPFPSLPLVVPCFRHNFQARVGLNKPSSVVHRLQMGRLTIFEYLTDWPINFQAQLLKGWDWDKNSDLQIQQLPMSSSDRSRLTRRLLKDLNSTIPISRTNFHQIGDFRKAGVQNWLSNPNGFFVAIPEWTSGY